MRSASLLVQPANGKAAATSLSLGRDTGSLGASGWVPVSGLEQPPAPELLEVAAHPLIGTVQEQDPIHVHLFSNEKTLQPLLMLLLTMNCRTF